MKTRWGRATIGLGVALAAACGGYGSSGDGGPSPPAPPASVPPPSTSPPPPPPPPPPSTDGGAEADAAPIVFGARIVNASARALVPSSGTLPVTIGMAGVGTKKLIWRALGPDLPVNGPMANPTLSIHPASGGADVTNDQWQSDPSAADVTDAGVAPLGVNDSALERAFGVDAYAAQLTSVDGTPGVALLELYDVDGPSTTSRVTSFAATGHVGNGEDALIGGFIVANGNVRVLVRVLGPSLGIAGGMADPTLSLLSGGTTLATNDNWRSSDEKTISDTKLQPTSDAEAAVVVTLVPGQYTVTVGGAGGTTGIAKVEVYDVGPPP